MTYENHIVEEFNALIPELRNGIPLVDAHKIILYRYKKLQSRVKAQDEAIRVMREALDFYAKDSEFVRWLEQNPEPLFKSIHEGMKRSHDAVSAKAKQALTAADKICEGEK